ncbi:MAG: response regulator [Deltaproteobacteria bacterium]|nr:response regulator [Deltaproteobacteria bacterium]
MAYVRNDPHAPAVLRLKGKKVLIVDDFVNFRTTMKGMLAGLGITNIVEAFDGASALLRMSVAKYDIILCDYNLGAGKDGQQVLEEAKHERYIHYETIFMMVTAENTMDMVMGAAEYLPDDYLLKPFTKQMLEKKLLSCWDKKDALREIIRTIEAMDYEKALELCEAAKAKHPKHLAEILRITGEIYTKMGDQRRAEIFYKEVATMGRMPWAHFGLGRSQFLQGHYEDAKETFTQLIASNVNFIAAYDWLAKTLEATGDPKEAQNVLMMATNLSPRVVNRQKQLGALAQKNEDFKTSVKAFRAVVKFRNNSVFQSPADYTTLAKVLVDAALPQEGLEVLGEARQTFRKDLGAAVQIGLTESAVLQSMNRSDDARESLNAVLEATRKSPVKVPADVELELSKALITSGDQERGKELVRNLIRSNHENEALIADTKKMFEGLDMAEEGQELLDTAVEEVVEMNNQGVQLVKEGDLEKATSYFDKAAENLPDNKLINANAAYANMLYMKKDGRSAEGLYKAAKYLERVHNVDPQYGDLPNLLTIYRELSQEPLPWMIETR